MFTIICANLTTFRLVLGQGRIQFELKHKSEFKFADPTLNEVHETTFQTIMLLFALDFQKQNTLQNFS